MPNIMLSNELFSPMLSDARGLKRLLVELLPREEWEGVLVPRVVQKQKRVFAILNAMKRGLLKYNNRDSLKLTF